MRTLQQHLPDAELVEIADAGHFINFECAEEFSLALVRTLQRRPRVSSDVSFSGTINASLPLPREETSIGEKECEREEDDTTLQNRPKTKKHAKQWAWSFTFMRELFSDAAEKQQHQHHGGVPHTRQSSDAIAAWGSIEDLRGWTCSDPRLVL